MAKPLSNSDPNVVQNLPSPEDLEYKIILKGKILKSYGVEEIFDAEDGRDAVSKVARELSDITYLTSVGFSDFIRQTGNLFFFMFLKTYYF